MLVEHARSLVGIADASHAEYGKPGTHIVTARDDTGEVRAVERPGHPDFLATLYQPQLTSTPGHPHPVFSAFVDAVASAGDGRRSEKCQRR